MVSPRKLLPGHRGTGCMETGSAKTDRTGPASQRESLQAPLCRTASVQGVRQCIRPHDPVLERQAACGVCLQGLPPEGKKLLRLSPYPRGKPGYHGMGVSHSGAGQSRQRMGETCENAKNVGVEETGSRRPHFRFRQSNSAVRERDR